MGSHIISSRKEHLIIVYNNESRKHILPPTDKLAELAITSYFAREGRVEQICFILAWHVADSCPIPKSLGDVTRLPADIQKKWSKSYLEELKLLKNKNVYEVVDFYKRRKVIKNHWVFNIKSDGHYRFQLVAKEFSQIQGLDFDELFSPVVHYKTAHLFLAITILEDWDIHSIDIKTAYIYGNLDEKIYMEQPKDFRLSGKKESLATLQSIV